LLQAGAAQLAVFGQIRVEEFQPDYLRGQAAEHLAGSRVGERYPAADIDNHDSVGSLLDQGAEVTFAVGQRHKDRVEVEKAGRDGLVGWVGENTLQTGSRPLSVRAAAARRRGGMGGRGGRESVQPSRRARCGDRIRRLKRENRR
jgi:hypothetical protein